MVVWKFLPGRASANIAPFIVGLAKVLNLFAAAADDGLIKWPFKEGQIDTIQHGDQWRDERKK